MASRLRYLIPSLRLRLETRHTPDEVEEAVSQLMRGEYDGDVSETGFQFRRVVHYQNAFLPWVFGVIQPRRHGSRVDVHIRCAYFVLVFMTVWMAMATVGGIVMPIALLFAGHFHPLLLGAPAMPLLGAAMLGFGFGREAKRVEELLRSALPPASPS